MRKPAKMKVRNFVIKKEKYTIKQLSKLIKSWNDNMSSFGGVKLVSFNVSFKQDINAIKKHYEQKKHENG